MQEVMQQGLAIGIVGKVAGGGHFHQFRNVVVCRIVHVAGNCQQRTREQTQHEKHDEHRAETWALLANGEIHGARITSMKSATQ